MVYMEVHLLKRMSQHTVDSAKVSLQGFDFLSSEHLNEQNTSAGGQAHDGVECGGVRCDGKLDICLSIKVGDATIVYLHNGIVIYYNSDLYPLPSLFSVYVL